MARLPRMCVAGVPQHVIQRGVNRQPCFVTDVDKAAYANWLYESSKKYDVAIHAWVFMTNHVHLLVTPSTPDGVSKMMQALGRYYVRYFNRAHERTGTLWEGRFKSCAIEAEKYLLNCYRYIELNPVRAGMVKSPEMYKWSSYSANALGKEIRLCTPHYLYKQLGENTHERTAAYRELFKNRLKQEFVDGLRQASHKGMAVGSEGFLSEIEALSGRRMRPLKPGPKGKRE